MTGSDKENTPCGDVQPTPPGGAPSSSDSTTATTSGSSEEQHTESVAMATASGSDDVTSTGFQMLPGISDVSRHRGKRSNRKQQLRNRNSVPEEVVPERNDDVNNST